MRLLHPDFDLRAFWERVRAGPRRALLLDYDGTLAPFRVQPNEAIPYDGVSALLDAIIAAGRTRVAIVSGRACRDLGPLLGLDRLPEIWGTHGWERLRPDGTYEVADVSDEVRSGLAHAAEWLRGYAPERLEEKPVGVALHWRGLDAATIRSLRGEARAAWGRIAAEAGLRLTEFDGGLELRAPDRDKGFAVDAVRNELGPDAAMAYLGDDATDEDAFARVDGHGLRVLVRSELHPTGADLWLVPPVELLDFLACWRNAAAGMAGERPSLCSGPGPTRD